MPSVRKLSPEEVQTFQDKGKGVRKLTEEQYDRVLADFEVGDYGEIVPDADEKRLTARNRLKAAASRRGIAVTFLRTQGEAMRFKVDTSDGQVAAKSRPVRRVPEPQPEPEPEPPPVVSETPPAPKRRGGRPKKVVG